MMPDFDNTSNLLFFVQIEIIDEIRILIIDTLKFKKYE
jgi:hypothetical protein